MKILIQIFAAKNHKTTARALVCVLCIVSLLAPVSIASFAAEKEKSAQTRVPYSLGDLTGDGKIKAADARLALRNSANLTKLSAEQTAAADVLFTGEIKAQNARKILRLSANLEEIKSMPELSAKTEIQLKTAFLKYLKVNFTSLEVKLANIDMVYIDEYDNGIAGYVNEPAIIIHDAIIPISIGDNTFFNAHPAFFFYAFESDSFVRFDKNSESELLKLLSNDELKALSDFAKQKFDYVD